MRSRQRQGAELGRALQRAPVPDAAAAEERAWRVIQAAYAERERTPEAIGRGGRRLALAFTGALAIGAIALSPAGAKVGDLVTETLGIDSEQALPELRSLPAAGELLVESADGAWIVREDGSKRLLGGYEEASWSPRGLFVVATDGNDLVALEPDGDVRWTVTAPAAVHDPRWGGVELDTRIAYRSGGDLWVVAGDGTDPHLIARRVAPVPPLWLPLPPEAKIGGLVPGDTPHVLAYVDRDGSVRVVEADSGRPVRSGFDDGLHGRALQTDAALAPAGDALARVVQRRDRSALVVQREADRDVLFSGPGRLTDPVWSPDGRWLLVGWRDADQWLFIDSRPREHPNRPQRVVAIDDASSQFDPGDTGERGFPLPAGWLLPER